MHLTTQMQAEIGTIRTRVGYIVDQVWHPLEKEMMRRGGCNAEDKSTSHSIIAELDAYKVRLENILCETDIKEQARSSINHRIVKFLPLL